MAPNTTQTNGARLVCHDELEMSDCAREAGKKEPEKRKHEYVWFQIIMFSFVHIGALYATYLIFVSARVYTTIFAIFCQNLGVLGITAAAHRFWSHRSYKAKWPLQILLLVFNMMSFQGPALHWARDHRVHHKFSETDADPQNSKRGFFFAHIGWLFVRKNPQVAEKGKQIDMSDLYSDPILRFQYKYYYYLAALISFFIPTIIPCYFWGETLHNSWYICAVWRFFVSFTIIASIGSFGHKWGYRPYDKSIMPTDLWLLDVLSIGECSHNYHHVFPWDYKASEFGFWNENLTTAFIDLCAKLGLAYDMKTISPEMIERRVKRTGDGSHEIWGWGDKDHSEEQRKDVLILNRKEN